MAAAALPALVHQPYAASSHPLTCRQAKKQNELACHGDGLDVCLLNLIKTKSHFNGAEHFEPMPIFEVGDVKSYF